MRPRCIDRRLDAGQPRGFGLGTARGHGGDREAPPPVAGSGRRTAAGVHRRRRPPRHRQKPPRGEPGGRLAARRRRSSGPGDERPAVASSVRRARLRGLVRVGSRPLVRGGRAVAAGDRAPHLAAGRALDSGDGGCRTAAVAGGPRHPQGAGRAVRSARRACPRSGRDSDPRPRGRPVVTRGTRRRPGLRRGPDRRCRCLRARCRRNPGDVRRRPRRHLPRGVSGGDAPGGDPVRGVARPATA